MKYAILLSAAVAAAIVLPGSAQTLPGAPENNGLTPKTATGFVNGTNSYSINNFGTESLSIDIANNGNMIVGWEDDGGGLQDIESVWTLLDSNGNLITSPTVVSNRSTLGALGTLEVTTNIFLSYYRSDNTSIPGYTGWGPKVKANRFGNGFGMGALPWEIGLEVPELYVINEDSGGPPPASDDFVCVQLLNNDGTPLRPGIINGITNLGIVTFADEDVQPAGAIRIGGWDYLSSGNILIVGDSRQAADRALTGQTNGNVPVYRIVTPGGIQVKGYSAISSTPDAGGISRNGAAVTASGFAVRWQGLNGQAYVRLFDNSGTPTSVNLSLTNLTGHAQAGGGGDGSNHGMSSNGKDAYVISSDYNIDGTNGIWVTVLNANGTVRWSRDVASDMVLSLVQASSAAIDESGQVVVVFSSITDAGYARGVMGRRFNAAGNPVGGTFYISEIEVPDPALFPSTDPKVAWRNGKIAVTWISRNYPDPSLTGATVIAYRLFVASPLPGAPENNGLPPKTATFYINGTNGVNNLSTEAPGVGIANNGNVLVAWEDDGSDMDDIEAVWTMFDSNGNWLTPNTKIDSLALSLSVTNKYLSFFRPNGSPTPGYVSWGPKVHANLFGSGIGMGGSAMDGLGAEIVAYTNYTGTGDFPAVQTLDDNGGPLGNVAGVSTNYAAPSGSIRIGDWEYLANGNIVIAGDSRQSDDLVNVYGGTAPFQHSIYSVVTPAGIEVRTNSLVSDSANQTGNQNIWHGIGATKNGFAIRFQTSDGRVRVRLFDNSGNPLTTNLVFTTITGDPRAGGGGRGDGAGFHGNGKDAYVHAADYTYAGATGWFVTVLNTNGTVRWCRDVSDDLTLTPGSVQRGDAAINEAGEVLAVYAAKPQGMSVTVVMGRRFDAAGNPLGGTSYISEKELPDPLNLNLLASDTPRAAWRNGGVAVVWVSRNDPNGVFGVKEMTQRYFLTGTPPAPTLSISHTGNSVTISWPVSVTGFILESKGTLAPGVWNPVSGVVNNSLTVVNPSVTQFYRLKQ